MFSGHDALIARNIGWKTLDDRYEILAKNIGYITLASY
jgi:hypothetical protein